LTTIGGSILTARFALNFSGSISLLMVLCASD
jgi:hypothetical protein